MTATRCSNCGAALDPVGGRCRYCHAPVASPVSHTKSRSRPPTAPARFVLPPRPRSSSLRRLGRLALWAVIVGLLPLPVNGRVALALLACIVVKVVLACIRSSRDQRGISQEWGRVTQENFRRLYTEAQVRLDPYNQNPNAQSQILGDLMRWYFPTTVNAQVETCWGATLGWQRADEGSPWEPTMELRGKQRVMGPLPPDEGSTVAVYRSPA